MIHRTLKDGRTVTARRNGGIRKRCGCSRSAWTRCPHPWHANVSHDGREHRVSLHKWAKKPADYLMLHGEAKTLFREWIVALTKGPSLPVRPPAPTLTFDAIAADYLKEYVHHPDRRPRAAQEMARQVGVLREAFGAHEMTSLTKPMIEAFRLARRQAHEAGLAAIEQLAAWRKGHATDDPVTPPADLLERARRAMISTKGGRVATNRLLTRLSHLFAWAIAEKELLETSPFTKGGVTVIRQDRKAEGPRSRRFDGDEEARLFAAAGSHLRACIEATLETGMRKSEILGLQWQHVLTAGILALPGTITKTGIARTAIITPRLAAILEMRATAQRVARELPSDADLPATGHPFGNELGERVQDFRTAWRNTCQRAGITGLHFHDLRRESGSQLAETPGVSLTDVRDFLGHQSVTQTNTYLATTTLRLKDALTKRDAARTLLAHAPIAAETAAEAPTVTH